MLLTYIYFTTIIPCCALLRYNYFISFFRNCLERFQVVICKKYDIITNKTIFVRSVGMHGKFESIKFIFNKNAITKILIIGGIVIYILSRIFMDVIPDVQPADSMVNKVLKYICHVLFDVLKVLAGVAISSGVISLLLEISTMKATVLDVNRSLMDNILNADFDLQNYSTDVLDRLHKNIVICKNQNKISLEMLENSIYTVEPYINRLLTGLFHEYHLMTSWITPDEERSVFKKRIQCKYNVINYYELKNEIVLKLAFLQEKALETDEEKKKKLEITKFRINNMDLIEEVPELLFVENISGKYHSVYDYWVVFKKNLQESSCQHVEINYEYEVPITDLTQSYKIMKPCKNFRHKVYLDGGDFNRWQISVSGFASLFYSGSELESSFKVTEDTPHCAEVYFDNWILPGAGYVISLNRKPEEEV